MTGILAEALQIAAQRLNKLYPNIICKFPRQQLNEYKCYGGGRSGGNVLNYSGGYRFESRQDSR
jgi:hypothetical protein